MSDRPFAVPPSADEDSELIAAARALVEREAAAVAAVADRLDEHFVAAARLLLGVTGKVVTAGVGTSGPVARRMAHLLSTSGTSAFFLHPADALHGSLGAVGKGDVVVAISKGGRSAELNEFAARAKTLGAALLVLTVVPDSPLGRLGDVTVRLPETPEADPGGVVAMGSSLVAAVWGDALAIVLMRLTGYGWAEVMHAHPAGAVGQRAGLPDELPLLAPPAAAPED
jgi:D-arabinose 5-phosphate isomerase GutQ